MLLICASFYCLSNVVLLVCFSMLGYKQLRGAVLLLYDSNQILDQLDKGLYLLCALSSCLVIALTLYPAEGLLFLVKLVKLSTESVLLHIFLRLT